MRQALCLGLRSQVVTQTRYLPGRRHEPGGEGETRPSSHHAGWSERGLLPPTRAGLTLLILLPYSTLHWDTNICYGTQFKFLSFMLKTCLHFLLQTYFWILDTGHSLFFCPGQGIKIYCPQTLGFSDAAFAHEPPTCLERNGLILFRFLHEFRVIQAIQTLMHFDSASTVVSRQTEPCPQGAKNLDWGGEELGWYPVS